MKALVCKEIPNLKGLQNYFFALLFAGLPSILSLRACNASLASPKVGFASAACASIFLAAAFTFAISSALKIAVWDATTRLNSLLNSIILNSAESPFLSLLPSSF